MEDIIRVIDGETVNLSKPIPDDAEPAYEAAWSKGMAELDQERKAAEEQKEEEEEANKEIIQSETPKRTNEEKPICPHCGKPLIDINIGEAHFYGHEDNDPCKEMYSSLEDIENTRKNWMP